MSINMKKVSAIALKVLTIALIVFTLAIMVFTVFSAVAFDEHKRSLFGYGFYIVQSPSMEKNKDDEIAEKNIHNITFAKNDLIVVKRLSDEEKRQLKEGDVIIFTSTNPDASFGQNVTHMIYALDTATNKETGEKVVIGYKTVGVANGMIAADQMSVSFDYIHGKYTSKLPMVGHFFSFMKTTPGYIVCILVPFLLLIIYNGLNCVRIFKQYKGEQRAAIQAERDEIEKERQQNADMLRQLQELQAQLMSQGAVPPASASSPVSEAAVDDTPSDESQVSTDTTESKSF